MEVTTAFNNIYNESLWGDENGTKSGGGSTRSINRTRNLFLAFSILRLNVKEIYDICGDCNWQKDFMKLLPDRQYFGVDASSVALDKARGRLLPNMQVSAKVCDMVKNCPPVKNPKQSLFIVKEVIQHLPLNMGVSFIKNIKNAGVQFIAITHHDPKLFHNGANGNMDTPGGFYPNNIFIEPFNFKNPIFDVSDFLADENKQSMGNLLIFDLQQQNI